MTQMQVKLSVAGVVLAAVVSYLVYVGVGAAEPTMSVDDFLAGASKRGDRQLRLWGTVAKENLDIDPNELTARFDLVGRKGNLTVTYDGVLPNLFEAGREIIIRGKVDKDGVFKAQELLTKCPSKYAELPKESEKPQ